MPEGKPISSYPRVTGAAIPNNAIIPFVDLTEVLTKDRNKTIELSELINASRKQGALISNPPIGRFKVVNIYIENGKLKLEYDTTPIT
jgi:hypothetical protein